MATENSTEIKKITLPTVPSEDDEKRYRQNKENFIQTKTEIDQTDLDAIERADRENREILIRNIVKPTEGLTVSDQISLQDIKLLKPNITLPLQLLPNVNVIVDEITTC